MASADKTGLTAALLRELYERSRAREFGVAESQFAPVLERITGGNDAAARALKVEDLALAQGCAAGNDHAWEVFLTRFREKLYDTAQQITREESAGRELADSIYAELYGMREDSTDGKRISKLASYSGRGSLEGWLRTVLAQEWVNRFRKQKRLVSLEEQEEAGAQFAAAAAPEAELPADPALSAATDRALAELSPEDRYVLAAYYLDERTLADVARTLGVHESTVSRKVERLAHKLRKDILMQLMKGGMGRRQAEEAMEVDVRDLAVDVRKRLKKKASAPGLAAPD